ncbi:MAG: endonuclease/exonuclease/phosphatase family protein [Myxococcota bacterium]
MRFVRSLPCLVVLLSAGCLSEDVSLSEDGGDDSSGGDVTGDTTGGAESSGTDPTTGVDPSADAPPSTCDDTPIRVATFNIESVSLQGSDPFVGLAASIARVGADVICMQEVQFDEAPSLQNLAEAAGYTTVIQADRSPAIGGDLTNACMSRVPMTLIASYTGSSLSSDPNANDVGRDILAVRVEPEPGCAVALFTLHFKSGGDYEDLFRRQVEAERLARGVRTYREQRPGDGVIVLGDFNEQLDDNDLGSQLAELPSTLPQSYRLGGDIELPLRYQPFDVLTDQGFQIVEAYQEDTLNPDTFVGGNFTSQLDYIVYGQALLQGAEIYNACQDNGVDDDPPGGWLPKEGEALACYSTQIASDHLAVFADFVLP